MIEKVDMKLTNEALSKLHYQTPIGAFKIA